MRKVLLLLITILFIGCNNDEFQIKDNTPTSQEVGCLTLDSDNPVSSEAPLYRMAQKTVTIFLVIDKSWVDFYGSEQGALNMVNNRMEQVKKVYDAEFSGLIRFNIVSTTFTTLDYGASTPTSMMYLRQDYPNMIADITLHIGKGRSGMAYLKGAGVLGSHYATVLIDNVMRDYPIMNKGVNDIAHEIGHLLGADHTHACVYVTETYASGGLDQLDILGSSIGQGSYCRALNRNWAKPDFGTIMSYGTLVSGQANSLVFHEQNKNQIINFLSTANIGCSNPVYEIKLLGNKLIFKDDIGSAINMQYGRMVLGNTQFSPWQRLEYGSISENTVQINHASTYTSSGSLGWKFQPVQPRTYKVNLRGNFPIGTKVLYSYGRGNVSMSGALNMTADSTVTVPAGMDYVNVRPNKNGTNTRVFLTYTETSNTLNEKSFVLNNLLPNSQYVVRIKPDCGANTIQIVFMTAPDDILNYIYDSGGENGMYKNNEDIWYYSIKPPQGKRVRLHFQQWLLGQQSSPNDYLEIYVNGLLFKKYSLNVLPPTYLDLNGEVQLHWVSDGIAYRTGFKIKPEFIN